MRLLDAQEVDLLARALPCRYQALRIVAAYTGRLGELAGLRIAAIDMLRRRLTVRSALIEAAGEAPRLGRPKTAASERTITLPGISLDAIAQHIDRYPLVDGLMWTTERGAYLRRGSFSRIWRTAVAETVGQPCRIHDLRHTHASWLIAAGEHPKTIQTRLGHSSIQDDGPLRTSDGGPRRPHRRPSRRSGRLFGRPRSGPNRPSRRAGIERKPPDQGGMIGSPDRIRTGVSGLKGRARAKRSLTAINADGRKTGVDRGECRGVLSRRLASFHASFRPHAAQERPKVFDREPVAPATSSGDWSGHAEDSDGVAVGGDGCGGE